MRRWFPTAQAARMLSGGAPSGAVPADARARHEKPSIMSFYIDRRSSTAVARVDTDAPSRRDAPTSQPPSCELSPARVAMGYAGSPAVPHRRWAQGSGHTSVGPTRRGELVLAVENYALVSKRQRGTIEAVEAMEGSGLRTPSRLPHHVACPNKAFLWPLRRMRSAATSILCEAGPRGLYCGLSWRGRRSIPQKVSVSSLVATRRSPMTSNPYGA